MLAPTLTAHRHSRRRRGVTTTALLLIGALSLTACAGSPAAGDNKDAGATASSQISLVDQRGETVTIDGPVDRIAFTVIPAPSIFAALDQSYDRIVGINQSTLVANQNGMFATLFPESTRSAVVSGSDFVPNIETLIGLQPDVVVQWGDQGSDVVTPITDAGMPVVGLTYGTQEDLETWITLFATLAGKTERGEQLIDWQHDRIEQVSARVAEQTVDKPRAMMLAKASDSYTTTTDTGYDGFQFDLVGADLVTTGFVSDNSQVGAEQILAWDPEVIFLSAFDETTPEQILADPQLASVSAVKNNRVYKTPLGAYRWQVPSAESPLMWEWMFSVLYPEAETDLRAQVTDAFTDLFAYDISDDEIDQVLRFDLNADSSDYDKFTR